MANQNQQNPQNPQRGDQNQFDGGKTGNRQQEQDQGKRQQGGEAGRRDDQRSPGQSRPDADKREERR